MKITNIITSKKPSLSFEVFPPKTDSNFEAVKKATEEIASLNPSYMSVTYGAGGGTSQYTASISADIQNKFGVPVVAHLSCITSTRDQIKEKLDHLKSLGIENILALRGDIPQDFDMENLEYHWAGELAEDIKKHGDFCIGGACYPEGHPESPTSFDDINYLKYKIDCGCEYLTTQMFFDNNVLYNFMYRIREAGINVPVVAGIMPVTNPKQIKRICSISGTSLPQRFVRIVDKFGSSRKALMQAAVAYATEQIVDLYANGINAVHVYSMNNFAVAEAIQNNISAIIEL